MAFVTLGGASENNFQDKSSCRSSVVVGSHTAEQVYAIALDMLPNTMLDNLLPPARCYTVEQKPSLASPLTIYHKRTASLF